MPQRLIRAFSPPWFRWSCVAVLIWWLFLQLVLSTETPIWIPEFLRSLLALPPDNQSSLLARRGQLGDSFGLFNALVSSLALVGVISTLALQQSIAKQQQFQEQLFHAVEAYQSLLASFEPATLGFVAAGEGETLRGRTAMQRVWQRHVVASFSAESEALGVSELAKGASGSPAHRGAMDFAAVQRAIESATSHVGRLLASPEGKLRALEVLGQGWWTLYSSHKPYLDALFRAWYTVHRILNEAPAYRVGADAQRLYAASFRAQISWIEMVYLLANQSGLPHNEKFPRACRYSNSFCFFDNLGGSSDITVLLLVAIAKERESNPKGTELNRAAFVRDPG